MYSLLLESPAPRGPADFIVPKGANVEVIIALARARQFTLCVCLCVCEIRRPTLADHLNTAPITQGLIRCSL